MKRKFLMFVKEIGKYRVEAGDNEVIGHIYWDDFNLVFKPYIGNESTVKALPRTYLNDIVEFMNSVIVPKKKIRRTTCK